MKPLERIFFMACLHEQMRVCELNKREFSVRAIGNIFERLGFSYKQLMYYVEKWDKRGFYEYGVSFDLGWFVIENLTGEYKKIYEEMGVGTPWRDMEFAKYIVQRSVATKHITNFSLRNQLGIGEDREFYNPYRDEDMPDKSLKFAKERISSSAFVCLENIEEKMQRIPYSMVRREKIENKLAFGYKTMHISVLYNPEAEFDYLSSASCRCDGTLTFAFDLCDEIIVNLLSGKSCYEFKKPKDLDISPWNYDVEFEVGDFVFVEEYGKQFSTKEKPWMTSRFTVMLPVKCDFKKR